MFLYICTHGHQLYAVDIYIYIFFFSRQFQKICWQLPEGQLSIELTSNSGTNSFSENETIKSVSSTCIALQKFQGKKENKVLLISYLHLLHFIVYH